MFWVLLSFYKCGPQTNSGWPPLLHTDFQRFILFFLVRGFDRWIKKSQNQNSEESLFGLSATQFPTVDLNVLRSKRTTVGFQAKFMESRLRRKPKVGVLERGPPHSKNRDWKEKIVGNCFEKSAHSANRRDLNLVRSHAALWAKILIFWPKNFDQKLISTKIN